MKHHQIAPTACATLVAACSMVGQTRQNSWERFAKKIAPYPARSENAFDPGVKAKVHGKQVTWPSRRNAKDSEARVFVMDSYDGDNATGCARGVLEELRETVGRVCRGQSRGKGMSRVTKRSLIAMALSFAAPWLVGYLVFEAGILDPLGRDPTESSKLMEFVGGLMVCRFRFHRSRHGCPGERLIRTA